MNNSKKIITAISISISIILTAKTAVAINTCSTGYQVNNGGSVTIICLSQCREVSNSGTAIFVPTKTAAEWNSFLSNHPGAISLGPSLTYGSEVGECGTYYNNPKYNGYTVDHWAKYPDPRGNVGYLAWCNYKGFTNGYRVSKSSTSVHPEMAPTIRIEDGGICSGLCGYEERVFCW